jgi:hypothetical protein
MRVCVIMMEDLVKELVLQQIPERLRNAVRGKATSHPGAQRGLARGATAQTYGTCTTSESKDPVEDIEGKTRVKASPEAPATGGTAEADPRGPPLGITRNAGSVER